MLNQILAMACLLQLGTGSIELELVHLFYHNTIPIFIVGCPQSIVSDGTFFFASLVCLEQLGILIDLIFNFESVIST